MNICISIVHEGVAITTLKRAVWYYLYNYEYNYDLMHWNKTVFHFSMQPYDLSDAYTASVWNNTFTFCLTAVYNSSFTNSLKYHCFFHKYTIHV